MFGQETFYENGLLFLHSQTYKIEGKLENSESKRETNRFDVALINGGTREVVAQIVAKRENVLASATMFSILQYSLG